MIPGISPVIGGAPSGTFITASTWSSGGLTYAGYEAGSRGTLQAGEADPWAQYLIGFVTIDTGGGFIVLGVTLSGDRLGLVSGKDIYVDGVKMVGGTWSYLGGSNNKTVTERAPSTLMLSNGVTYRIEIK